MTLEFYIQNGTFSSIDDAKKHEREIEYFKKK